MLVDYHVEAGLLLKDRAENTQSLESPIAGPVVRIRKRSPASWLLRLVLFGILALLAYRFVDGERFLEILASISWPWVLSMVAIATIDRWLMAAKWSHLGAAIGVVLPFRETLKAYYAASFLNYTVPTTLSGDVYRAYHVNRNLGKVSHLVATMVMEKALGVLSTVLLAWIGLGYLAFWWISPIKVMFAWGLFATTAIISAVFLLSLHPRAHRLLGGMLRRAAMNKAADRLDKFFEIYRRFSTAKGELTKNVGLCVVENLIQMSIMFLSAYALSISVDAVAFFTLIMVATLIRRLSIVFDSWGVSEALTIALLGLVGINPTAALAISLLRHAAIAVASLPGALILGQETRKWTGREVTRARS